MSYDPPRCRVQSAEHRAENGLDRCATQKRRFSIIVRKIQESALLYYGISSLNTAGVSRSSGFERSS